MLVHSDHRPRKRFGQNFLHDEQVVQLIVNAINPKPEDHIVEIGPGLGAITQHLMNHCAQLDLIELDKDLAGALTKKLAEHASTHLHRADALQFDFTALAGKSNQLRIVGNLPYNISTPLIFHLLAQGNCINDMLFMLQKEVVDRLCATPGGKNYGRLSVMTQYYCSCEALFDVPPHAFTPQPKVTSAVIHMRPLSKPSLAAEDDHALNAIVKAAFGQRRKTLRNTLKPLLSVSLIETLDIDPSTRAENLTVDQFVKLSNAFARQARE